MMGLFTTALAFGAGYTLGRPDGRAQVTRYVRRARELAAKPEAKHLRERGRAAAGHQVAATVRRIDARIRAATAPRSYLTAPTPVPDNATAGFRGTTAVDDPRADLGLGTPSPPHHPGAPGPTPPIP
jgi:hypothetical protein